MTKSSRDRDVWSLSRTILSDRTAGIDLVVELIEAMTKRDWTEAEIRQVRTAYEEAIVNAIVHGNKSMKVDAVVQVTMKCDPHQVRIEITDQGKGFDPASVPDPRQEKFLRIPGGRGVLLMREIMDELTYNGRGNHVTLVKNRVMESDRKS